MSTLKITQHAAARGRSLPGAIARCLLVILLVGLALLPLPAYAHASLESSTPAANERLPQTPPEVRLTFTEPVEEAFSSIALLDATGQQLPSAFAAVDADDPYQLVMPLATLPDGIYTVRWSVVSAADGHTTTGNFAFIVGSATASAVIAPIAETPVSPASVFVRWFNLLALSLLVGGIAYWLLVWQHDHAQPAATRLQRLVWGAWILTGVALVLMLGLQTTLMAAGSTREIDWLTTVVTVVRETRFGTLWLTRGAVWFALGLALMAAERSALARALALLLGLLMLLLQSMISHAAATPLAVSAIVSDWLHFTLTAFWLGGLVALLLTYFTVGGGTSEEKWQERAPIIAAFSNYARLLLVGLIATGIYAAWLQVGSWQGLLDTTYGNAMLAKLLLMPPLLALAAVNFVTTARSQQAGRDLWQGRLRALLSAEIALLLGVLAAVGILTSIVPTRTLEADRAAHADMIAAQAAQPAPRTSLQDTLIEDLHIHFEVSPNYVGENEFRLEVHDLMNHLPVVDISLIRLRFTSLEHDMGESELRITEGVNGVYSVRGANLSMPGTWQVRITIQRPNEFDAVGDIEQIVELPPEPEPPPEPVATEPVTPAIYYAYASLLTATVLLGIGGYFVGESGLRLRSGEGAVSVLLLLTGALLLLASALG